RTTASPRRTSSGCSPRSPCWWPPSGRSGRPSSPRGARPGSAARRPPARKRGRGERRPPLPRPGSAGGFEALHVLLAPFAEGGDRLGERAAEVGQRVLPLRRDLLVDLAAEDRQSVV